MNKIFFSVKWKLILSLCGLGMVCTFAIYLSIILLGYSNISHSTRQSPVLNWQNEQVAEPVKRLLTVQDLTGDLIKNHLANLASQSPHQVFQHGKLFTKVSVQSFAVVNSNSKLVFKTANSPLMQGDVGSQLPIAARDDLSDALTGQLNSGIEELGNHQYLVIKSIKNRQETIIGASISWQSWQFNPSLAPMFYISYKKALNFALVHTVTSIFWIVPASFILGWLIARVLQRRYKQLYRTIEDWGNGLLQSRIQYSGNDEISSSFSRLNQMAAKLQSHHKQLNHLAQVKERQQIALELHDTVKQQLFATNLQLSTAINASDSDPIFAKESMQLAIEQNSHAFNQINDLITTLNPVASPAGNFVNDLNQKLSDWQQQHPVEVHFDTTQFQHLCAVKLSQEQQQIIIRTIMEAMQNCHKHANAKNIHINIQADNGFVRWFLHNDGIQLSQAKIQYGQGLNMLNSQLEALGGRLSTDTQNGFKLSAQIPL